MHRDKARAFTDAVCDALGKRVQCIVLVGSVARGDHSPSSDIDIWVILDRVDQQDLEQIGRIVMSLGREPEINPQCASLRELQTPAFQQQFSSMQLHTDGVVLAGRHMLPPPAREEMRHEAAAIAGPVLMSARHYISTREPEEALRNGKLERWVLKALMWALRYDIAARDGAYPRTLDQLRASLAGTPREALVEAYVQLRAREFRGDCRRVLEDAQTVARDLLGC